MSAPKKIHPHHLSPEELNQLPGKEMKERRTRASKTYSLGSGLYQTVIYPHAVHFRTPQGAWEDIDHSLTPEQGSFRDHSGDLSVKFSPGGSVTLTKDGHSLSWQISGASPVEAVTENAASPFPRHAAEKRIENKVAYTNLFQDVDLLCEVKPHRFKDTLVFKDAAALQPVEFLLHTETLKLQQNAAGDVLAQCGKKTVFRLPAPCITDEKGHIISNNAHAELTQLSAADWRMTYEVSPEFAAVADYPLFLDPGVETEQTGDAMVMAFTSSKEPGTPHPVTGQTTSITSNNYALGKCDVFLRFADDALPEIDSSCYITNAVLSVQTAEKNPSESRVFLKEVCSEWDPATLTHTLSQNFSFSPDLDFSLASNTCNITLHYNITNLVRKWYQGGNNGVCLHVTSGQDVVINGPASSNLPHITITYVSLAGLESYLSQESHPCGRAGTAHVGLFNGNLVVSQPLTATNGHLLPVSVSRYYNSCYADQDLWGMGKGWKLSVQQSLHKETIGDTGYYVYTDGDGTQHHFKQENGKWQDQSGLSLTLTFEETEAIITDKGDNRMVFDKPTLDIDEAFANAKMLKSITDPCNNTVSFTMNGRLPVSVKDGAGRDTIFTSSNGHITNITAPGMTDAPVSIQYENGQASRILHEDRTENTDSCYHYNENGLLDMITHYDGSSIQIKYWDHKPYRVSEVFYLDKEGNASAGRRYTYGDCTTTVTDLICHTSKITGENGRNESGNSFSCGKKLKYHFNDAGNVLSVNDELGYGCFSGYNSDVPVNHPEYVSRMQRAVNNMLLHHNFQDSTNTYWVADVDSGAGQAGYQSENTYMSGRSYMLKRTADTGLVSAYQDIALVKGREYTFSVYYTNKSNARLRLRAEWQNASGETETAESFTPPITTVWKRLYVTFTLPEDALSDTVRLRMMAVNGLGEIDLDAAQLEEGPVPNRYNMLSNSAFRLMTDTGVPLGWYTSDHNTAADKVIDSASLNRPAQLSDKCMHLEGEPGKEKYIQQSFSCIGSAGDTFVLGGWSRAFSSPLREHAGRKYEMVLLVRPSPLEYQPGGAFAGEALQSNGYPPWKQAATLQWSDEWTDWHFAARPFTIPWRYMEVGVRVVYSNNLNYAEFTNLFLHKEEFGSTFIYDTSANVTAKKGTHSLSAGANYDANNNQTSYTDYGRSENYSIDYGDTEEKRKQHLLRKQTSPLGIITETDYDMDNFQTVEEGKAHGLPMKSRVRNNRDNLKMETAYKYTDNQNYTLEQTDARGKTITTVTDENLGTVTSVTDPMGQTVSYEYDAMRRNTAVTTTVGEGDNAKTYKNTYEYQGDKLVKVAHNTTGDTCDVVYHFGFDERNRATTVQVSNKLLPGENDTVPTLSTNEYNDDNTLKETTFGNGGKVMNTYDEFKRLKGVRYDSDTEDRYVYDYAANGQIAKVTDKNLNRVTVSEFDVANRPCQITTLENGSHLYNARLTYDEFSQPKSFQERVSGSFDFYRTDFAYDIEGKPTQLGYGLSDQERDNTKVVNAYDNLGRLASRTVKVDGTSYATSYTYLPGPEENTTTSLIASISQGSGENAENFVYTYDDNGNITSVSRNGVVTTYKYDALGQLIRTDDPFDPISGSSSGSTWTFAYDQGGNILNKKYYAFTTGDLPATPLRTYNYTYDSDWKDKLTSYYGFSYTYDAIGNPLTDGTWNYTWEKGRQLRQMRNGSMRILFAYDASGMRIKKTVNETDVTSYTYHGKNLVHLKKTGGTDMHFYYDAQNRPSVVKYNGNHYAYVYNLQGDVMALLDNTGTKVVSYSYNAWGKLLNTSGSMATTLGVLNPFRYRGYIYDEETGYYYLRSRYYYPNRCRFINADSILNRNLFVYCKNSPIHRADTNGCTDYATIGPNEFLFDWVYNQENILGWVSDYLVEQKRIIDANISYNWDGQSDKAGYSCATFISRPLQVISETPDDKNTYIRSHTGIGSMLINSGNHLLFIARLSDYYLDEIPVGASFLRTAGYNGNRYGHGATFAARLANGMLTINHAAGTEKGILSEDITYEELCYRFEYIAWPVGLGTDEEDPTRWIVIE